MLRMRAAAHLHAVVLTCRYPVAAVAASIRGGYTDYPTLSAAFPTQASLLMPWAQVGGRLHMQAWGTASVAVNP